MVSGQRRVHFYERRFRVMVFKKSSGLRPDSSSMRTTQEHMPYYPESDGWSIHLRIVYARGRIPLDLPTLVGSQLPSSLTDHHTG